MGKGSPSLRQEFYLTSVWIAHTLAGNLRRLCSRQRDLDRLRAPGGKIGTASPEFQWMLKNAGVKIADDPTDRQDGPTV